MVLAAETTLALKVDVDTLVGTREGVPRLADLLDARGLKASFFLSLGPDNSGRAVFRAFTRPGFLTKQLRSKAASAFGLKTLLYGTLLPAPLIGEGLEDLVRRLAGAGHEVGLHAWDHVRWHDRIWKMTDREVRAELGRGLWAFARIAGAGPKGFAAPAWRINEEAVQVLAKSGLTYTAATRGRGPYRPLFSRRPLSLLEIPTTLPTADEVLGRRGLGPEDLPAFFLRRLALPGRHVLTVHAEMEGRVLAEPFARLLDECLDRGLGFTTLAALADGLLARPELLPEAEVIRAEVPGRAGEVSHQGP
ncbi:MAG: polysaccharide deacetylase family protein [Thermodesulfobacteriota bacterium]